MSNPATDARFQEWRDGWQLIVACFMGAVLAGLALNTVGVFMRPLGAEFGWSSGAMSAAVPINGALMAITAPFVGGFIDRNGARRMGLLGCVLLPCAIASLGLIQHSIWSYWAAWAFISIAQVSATIMVWTMAVAGRFFLNRGLALAIVLMGNSAAGILYPPIGTLMIDHWGWRAAYLVTGLGIFILSMPVVWLYFYDWRDLARRGMSRAQLASTPELTSALSGMNLRQSVRTRQFWQFCAAIILGAGAAVTMFIHIIPLAMSKGLTPLQAASAASALGISGLLSKVVFGPLVDRMRAPPLAAITMLCPVLACLIFLSSSHLPFGLALVAAALVGLGTGAELDMIGVLAARMFGVRHYGRIYGTALTGFQIAVGIGPLLAGMTYDHTHSYGWALAGMICCLLLSVILFASLGRSIFEREPERFAAEG